MLPKIKIGVFDQQWHGCAVLKSHPKIHYVAIEDVAAALKMPVKQLCKTVGNWQDKESKKFIEELKRRHHEQETRR